MIQICLGGFTDVYGDKNIWADKKTQSNSGQLLYIP